MIFQDRTAAGKVLASMLREYERQPEVLVAVLPRGGVPVGFEIARALGVEMDVCVARKLGAPGQEELAIGAIAAGGVRFLNHDLIALLGISEAEIDQIAKREEVERARREKLYRGDRPAPAYRGRTVILVDDGIATGATMRAAIRAIRSQAPARIILAVPVAACSSCEVMRPEVEEMVCAHTPEPFVSVGEWYVNFPQVGDEEVRELLARAGFHAESPKVA